MKTPRLTLSLLPRFFPFILLGAALALAQPCLATPFTFDDTGNMNVPRYRHTSTLLQNGKVLVVGGPVDGNATAELYDPSTGTWTVTGSSTRARSDHTATLLLDGKVLITGGAGSNGDYLVSCELYDPNTGTWSDTNNLNNARGFHTATLLPDGKVLVAGGYNDDRYLASAEVYDPTQGTWTATASLNDRRDRHTMTLLANGKVLVTGGENDDTLLPGTKELSSCELYDPSQGTWAGTGSLGSARSDHTATLLPNGKVLMAGGYRDSNSLASAQLYDPATGQWTNTGSLKAARGSQTATLLPDGKVLVAGAGTSAELYEPSTGIWTTTDSMAIGRYAHTATLLPNGKVLVAGGNTVTPSAELYDPSEGAWSGTATTAVARALHTTTLLPNGQVLVTGGSNGSTTLSRTELYDVPTATWLTTTNLNGARSHHTATLLSDGKVLVAGGSSGSTLATAEFYDRSNATWTATGNLKTARYDHTATLLPSGKVLVTGGVGRGTFTSIDVSSAELFDPSTGVWTFTGSLATARHSHTATLLPSGKVLVTGGSTLSGNYLPTSELYDPSTGAWTATGSLSNQRSSHSATLLPNGKVLVAGGFGDVNACSSCGFLNSVELYNPASGTWTAAPNLVTGRGDHTATLLQDGRVLVDGGLAAGSTYLTSAELYDPAIGKWTPTGSSAARSRHTATLLQDGRVLAVGGYFANNTPQIYSSIYDAGFAYHRPDWQPQISSTYFISASDGPHLFLTGSRFQGLSQASSGTTQDSSTNYPVVQLRSLSNDQELFLSPDPGFGRADDLYESTAIKGFPFGPALVTVFANGIPSDAFYLILPIPVPPNFLGDVSTREFVQTGDNVPIGGFIITGTLPKKVLVRAMGPSVPVPGALADPTLELRDGHGTLIRANDNWRTGGQEAEILATRFQPNNDLESAIVETLPANGSSYTAIVRGVNNSTGVGLVEAYDLDRTVDSKLANISTRGFVQTGDNIMIAGTIIVRPGSQRVIVRALGPSVPVSGTLADPTLELRDGNGTLIRANDNWRTGGQEAEILATRFQPNNDLESAIVATLPASGSAYTAIVRGVNNTTGIALVEVYALK